MFLFFFSLSSTEAADAFNEHVRKKLTFREATEAQLGVRYGFIGLRKKD